MASVLEKTKMRVFLEAVITSINNISLVIQKLSRSKIMFFRLNGSSFIVYIGLATKWLRILPLAGNDKY